MFEDAQALEQQQAHKLLNIRTSSWPLLTWLFLLPTTPPRVNAVLQGDGFKSPLSQSFVDADVFPKAVGSSRSRQVSGSLSRMHLLLTVDRIEMNHSRPKKILFIQQY